MRSDVGRGTNAARSYLDIYIRRCSQQGIRTSRVVQSIPCAFPLVVHLRVVKRFVVTLLALERTFSLCLDSKCTSGPNPSFTPHLTRQRPNPNSSVGRARIRDTDCLAPATFSSSA